MSDFITFGRQLRELVTGMMGFGDGAPSHGGDSAVAWRHPPRESVIAYLAIAESKIWVRSGHEDRVASDWGAERVAKDSWKVPVIDAGGERIGAFAVALVDDLPLLRPEPFDMKIFNDHACGRPFASKGVDCEVDALGRSSTLVYHEVAHCVPRPGATCSASFSEVSYREYYEGKDCTGDVTSRVVSRSWICARAF